MTRGKEFFWHCRSLGERMREKDILIEARSDRQGQRVGFLFRKLDRRYFWRGKSGRER